MKEYIVYLNGNRLDYNGFYCNYPCVTAYNKAEALRIYRKAKKYYGVTDSKNSFIKVNPC